MFCKNLHVKKCKKCSICLSQFFCVQQNTTRTYFSLVKFSVLSFKIKIRKFWCPCSPMEKKVEHFFQKNWFTKMHIAKNAHLRIPSNFAKIDFNTCVKFFICKTRGLLPRFKMAENVVFWRLLREFVTFLHSVFSF